jgi:hypothetical protein
MHRTRLVAAAAQPIACFAVPVDENGFVDWLLDAQPGDAIAYYRGHLAHDRMPSSKVLCRQVRHELHALAKRVMAACEHGLVIPVQKRLGPEDFLYLVVKAIGGRKHRPSAAKPVALASTAPAVAPSAEPLHAIAA